MITAAPAISVEYALSAEEVWRGYVAHQKHSAVFGGMTGLVARIFGVFMLVIAVYAIWGSRTLLGPQMFPLLFGVYLLFGLRLAINRAYKRNPVLGQRYRVEVSDDGIGFTGERTRTELTWAAFTGFFETNGLFLLYQSPQIYHLVPQRSFSADDCASFRELLRSHAPVQPEPRSKRFALAVFCIVVTISLVLLAFALRNIR